MRQEQSVLLLLPIKYNTFEIIGKFQLTRDKLSFSKFVIMISVCFALFSPSSTSKIHFALCTWISSLCKTLWVRAQPRVRAHPAQHPCVCGLTSQTLVVSLWPKEDVVQRGSERGSQAVLWGWCASMRKQDLVSKAVDVQQEHGPGVRPSCKAGLATAPPTTFLSDLHIEGLKFHRSRQSSARIAEARSSIHGLHKHTHQRAMSVWDIDLQHIREFPSIFSHLQPQQHFQESEGGLLICFGCVCRQQLPWPDRLFRGLLWPTEQKQSSKSGRESRRGNKCCCLRGQFFDIISMNEMQDMANFQEVLVHWLQSIQFIFEEKVH